MRDSMKSSGQQMFFVFSVVMTHSSTYTCTVQYTVKMSLAILLVSNVILKLNTKNYLEDGLKKNEAFNKAVSRYEKHSSISKKLAVQIKVGTENIATKLHNVSPSAGSLLRRYITQLFSGTQTYILILNFAN